MLPYCFSLIFLTHLLCQLEHSPIDICWIFFVLSSIDCCIVSIVGIIAGAWDCSNGHCQIASGGISYCRIGTLIANFHSTYCVVRQKFFVVFRYSFQFAFTVLIYTLPYRTPDTPFAFICNLDRTFNCTQVI